jgi:WD40 repeat protein
MRALREAAVACAVALLLTSCSDEQATRVNGDDPITSPSAATSGAAPVNSAAVDLARRRLSGAAVSADGKLEAKFAKGRVTISTSDGAQVTSFDTASTWERPASDFSPDGRLFAISGPGKVFIYDLASKQTRTIPMDEMLTLRFSPDGRFLSGQGLHPDTRLAALGSTGESLYLSLDLPPSRNPLDPGQIWTASEVAISNDGNRVTAVGQDGVIVWTVNEPRLDPLPCGCELEEGTVDRAGRYAAYLIADGSVSIWSVADRREMFHSQPGPRTAAGGKLRFTEDGRLLLTIDGAGHEQVLSVPDGKMVTR